MIAGPCPACEKDPKRLRHIHPVPCRKRGCPCSKCLGLYELMLERKRELAEDYEE